MSRAWRDRSLVASPSAQSRGGGALPRHPIIRGPHHCRSERHLACGPITPETGGAGSADHAAAPGVGQFMQREVGSLALPILPGQRLKGEEKLLSDPDAWMNDITEIVSQKNQAKQDAATQKRERERHHLDEVQKVRELVQGQPTEAFERFGSHLNAEGESARIKHDLDDKDGPWVGIDISDADGKFLDIKLQGRVGL